MDNNKILALSLASCESEDEVINLLKEEGFWDNPSNWRPFGDNENNWSTIGNQQSEADAALVEKIVNSIDAMLMKECFCRGIAPDSAGAPKSIPEALENYFGIRGGRIQDLTQSQRTELAKSIVLTATGNKPIRGKESYPNITIIDSGEGQNPSSLPETILSINKSNKLKVPFVQGKFNMGGTGVLRFCGKNNIQLIISKRCPDIRDATVPADGLWGFTIVRRELPSNQNGRRSSMFTYLVNSVDRQVLYFSADEGIDVIPTSKGKNDTMKYGMYCKLFEYKLQSRLCSNINMGLYYRLSTLLPNLAYPVFLDECRDYRAHSMFRTLSGLNVRLNDQSESEDGNKIEEKISANFTIDGQKLSAAVYVFKKTTEKGKELDASQFRADEGIILTQNGQTHGTYDRKFYKRSNVNLSYLADSILTIVDCTQINEATREDLFMNSRDRLSAGNFATKLESELENFFKNNDTLKQIQETRREEAISDRLDDEKPLEDVLKSVFKASSILSRLFITGERLQNPTNLGIAQTTESFIGKKDPTYFTLIKKGNDDGYRKASQIGRKFRVKFKTDVENAFFYREDYPGEYSLSCNGIPCQNHYMNLHNGIATLNIELPEGVNVGDSLNFTCIVFDTCVDISFPNDFIVDVVEFEETGGKSGKRIPPNGKNGDNNSFAPNGISLPEIIPVYKDRWEEEGFTKESAMKIMKATAGEDTYDFYINMDNIHLQSEIKPVSSIEAKVKLLKARYKYGMVLIGLSILGNAPKEEESNKDENIEDTVSNFTKMISPVLLPMIEVMGSDMSDILK